jgi:hypothetical protein
MGNHRQSEVVMIEVYGFLAVFTVQLLAMSVLQPIRFSRYVRLKATSLPAERLAKLYPGVDLDLARERFLKRYRAANAVIAALGLLPLGWFFIYMRRPDWNDDPVILLSAAYFMLQFSPVLFVTWLGFRFNKALRHSLVEGKRKATLQRRGLFDYISPSMVFIAVASYFLFVGSVIYVQQEPFPGYALIGVLTLTYAVQAVVVYRNLYGKKCNPFETHAGRVHAIGLTVKSVVYGCIVCVAFFAFVFTVDLLEVKRWVPLAQSACFLSSTLLCLMGLTPPPREPEVDELGETPAT